jgi:F0F1-type ATP synthase delta subunit
MQLELFHLEKTDMEKLEQRVKEQEIRESNLRKGIFKRHGELAKYLMELKAENQELHCILKIIMKTMDEYYKKPTQSIQ